MSVTPAISFQNVGKIYSGARGAVKALDDVSFDIEPGEFFGLLGPNGAGKTTLISILAGLTRATRGQVLVHGHEQAEEFARFDVEAHIVECVHRASGAAEGLGDLLE